MTNIFHDQSAQAIPISYILTFAISVALLVIVVISYQVMVAGTSRQAMRVGYTDIGNDVAGTIADIYLTASAGSTGNVSRTIKIPTEVAGEGYMIEVCDSPFTSAVDEDFDDGTADGWTPIKGTWTVENGEYSCDTTTDGLTTLDDRWNDFALEVKMNMLTIATPAMGGRIVFRYQDSDNYYILYLLDWNDEVQLGKFSGGSFTWLQSTQPHPGGITTNTWYTVKIVVKGGATDTNIKCYVDGYLDIDYTDTSALTDGKIGLQVAAAHVHFDDVKVGYKTKIIKISAEHANVVVYVPLSNIDQSIDVSGKAYSGAGELKVEYDINKTITLS